MFINQLHTPNGQQNYGLFSDNQNFLRKIFLQNLLTGFEVCLSAESRLLLQPKKLLSFIFKLHYSICYFFYQLPSGYTIF